MRNKIYRLLIVMLLSSSLAVAQQKDSPQSNFIVYRSLSYGFSIQYPKTWEKHNGADYAVAFVRPKNSAGTSGGENLLIHVFNLSTATGQTLDDQAALNVKQLKTSYPNLIIMGPHPTTLANLPAREIHIAAPGPSGSIVKTMEVLLLKDHKVYAFAYSADKTTYDAYFPAIKQMLDSFKFSGASESPSR